MKSAKKKLNLISSKIKVRVCPTFFFSRKILPICTVVHYSRAVISVLLSKKKMLIVLSKDKFGKLTMKSNKEISVFPSAGTSLVGQLKMNIFGPQI